jgi:hypothetical protein
MLQYGREAEGFNDRSAAPKFSVADADDGVERGIKPVMGLLTGAILRREVGF